MSVVYVTFSVEVSSDEYTYRAEQKGSAEVRMQMPRDVLDCLDAGNVFQGALEAALVCYDNSESEEEE